ncbi:EF hand calcium-binding family protein [Melia azedarach]|uniref:EF hand calcium-binding family protein n=1 Tax=Melia azedarach TaxID=155640 RepID=A0ACC1WP50_MELAZ|nr:EF hand calcium-binding family protein [Melia azedarach]
MAQPRSLSAETETLSHVSSLVEAFRAFDSDNDESITVAELGGILSSLGYRASEEDVRAMMQEGDKNKDGLLSLEEFLEMNTRDSELELELGNSLRSAFESLNLDGYRVLTGQELYEVMENLETGLSLVDCQDIISSIDGDGDGTVSLEHFQLIVNSLQ